MAAHYTDVKEKMLGLTVLLPNKRRSDKQRIAESVAPYSLVIYPTGMSPRKSSALLTLRVSYSVTDRSSLSLHSREWGQSVLAETSWTPSVGLFERAYR